MLSKSGVFDGNTQEEEKVNQTIDKRQQEITFREFEGGVLTPWQTAINMFTLFDEIVAFTTWKDANDLKANLKKVCERMIERDRLNFVVRNCSERMLKILQQTCSDLKIELKASQGMSTIQSLRHLTMKKVSSFHDDFDFQGTSSEESNPFAPSDKLDFRLVNRRPTFVPPKTVRSALNMRLSFVDSKKLQLT